jgi:undecaprenyl-diphosphatase
VNQRLARWRLVDEELTDRASALVRSSTRRWVAWLLAHSGDSQWWLAAGLLLWWLGEDRWRMVGVRIASLTLVAGLGSTALKRILRRPRPNGDAGLLYLPFDRYSFPSGHATRVGGLVIVLGAVAPPWGAPALLAWGVAVGVSRVALGVHYAADVAAGWFLGLLLGFVLLTSLP